MPATGIWIDSSVRIAPDRIMIAQAHLSI